MYESMYVTQCMYVTVYGACHGMYVSMYICHGTTSMYVLVYVCMYYSMDQYQATHECGCPHQDLSQFQKTQ
jgi:hypothetical protein